MAFHKKMRILQRFKLVLAISLAAFLSALVPSVSADSLAATVRVNNGCVGAIDQSSATVAAGSSVNITVFNADAVVSQSVSGPGIPAGSKLQNNGRDTSPTQTYSLGVISSPVTITFTPIPKDGEHGSFVSNCPTGSSPTASRITITPQAARPAPAAATASPQKATTSGSSQAVTMNDTVTAQTAQTTSVSNEAATEKSSESKQQTPDTKPTAEEGGMSNVAKIGAGSGLLIVIALATAAKLGYLPCKQMKQKISCLKLGMRP